jgi:methionyl-tRNA synthetase
VTRKEALEVLEDFIRHHGRARDCGVRNPDGSQCHACKRELKETEEAQQALKMLEAMSV